MNPRLKKFTSKFDEYKIDAYLVTSDVNVRYLTKFSASESWLLVLPEKTFYITDPRYYLEAKNGLKGIHVPVCSKTLTHSLVKILDKYKVRFLGFDEKHLSVAMFKNVRKVVSSKTKMITKNYAVESLREIKERQEIALIRKAVEYNLDAYKYLKRVVKPGICEKDVLSYLENYVNSKGVKFSFDPIIASGLNSCFPHARVTDRKIRNNDVVLVDMGIDFNGYKSDLTRMFFLGKIAPHVQEVIEAVSAAQKQAIGRIKAGIPASEIDNQARNYLKKQRLSRYFSHSLGHGVGLDIHEGPRISFNSSDTLKSGMIVTVEPGVYIPNKFGIRIEDMVLVTKNGCELLS